MTYKKVDLETVRQRAREIRLVVLDVDGVLTDGRLWFDAKGKEFKVFNVKDGYGIRRIIDAGIQVAIISGRKCVAVEKRAAELGIEHVFLGIREKRSVFEKLLTDLGLSADQVACMGDDTPDLPCLEAAGLAVAVADAHSDLDAVVDWHTQSGGGQGAVRELCDLLISVHQEAG